MSNSETQEAALEADFDIEALRARYKAERDKRLRTDADRQYKELSGDYARYAEEDPYVEPGFTREPLTDFVEVAVIGGGFSGMLAAARLKEKGVTDLRIIEAGGDFGGTWYWNRYPGAQCDIESYCYLPLLEELNYLPKEKYSYVTEIYEHCQRIGKHYDLYPITLFQTRVSELAWDDAEKVWVIRTNHGDAIRARFVVSALGTASRAKLPGIPGIESFEGHSFHTSRWDYGYTGGDTTGNLWKLEDKTVAIIGTGATAIQCIPALGRHARQLYVFQRTPSSVDTRGNKPTDPEWAQSLEPGWQRARRHNFADIIEGRPFEHDLVNDNWTSIFREVQSFVIRNAKTMGPEAAIRHAEVADFRKMNRIRQRVDEVVKDPDTAEKLKPWYRQFCKRPTFNDEFLPTFNRPNVTLVDVSESKGVERITPKGLVANGREYEVDCIIYASGFEITTSFKRRVGFDIKGRDGVLLHDHWANGYKTLHGFATTGFPNWFYIGVSQNGLSVNMTAMFDDQAQHIAYIIAEAKKRGATEVEPTPEAQDAWVSTIKKLSVVNRAYLESCTPGYYNNEGDLEGGQAGQTYAPGINAFNALLADWRNNGELQGLALRA
ncbi:NAD(P)/FAD-dependent oxidoreductase [Sphingomonas sp.]|jgi:cyclohexanone monooxygenase|uniref:flavin-containing monooxygenase n=1 Tax=Sphingomonas sp. TaxID=28214 RepID=UPI0026079B72|nr:NAD(P)/FAD-dependent oxidoreductase [Sphingomonas sp.]MDF2605310.1 NAD(P)/FAD-dependent oxidoreductase [Sphingomonas sp.]